MEYINLIITKRIISKKKAALCRATLLKSVGENRT